MKAAWQRRRLRSLDFVGQSSNQIYATRANRIVVKHRLGRIVSVIEIVSPGNKDSRAALRDFVDKVIDFLRGDSYSCHRSVPPNTARPLWHSQGNLG